MSEYLENRGNPEFLDTAQDGEGKIDENARMQEELMGLKNSIEEEKVTPITREDIDSLTRRNPIN